MTFRHLRVTLDEMVRAAVVYAVGLILIIGAVAGLLWLLR